MRQNECCRDVFFRHGRPKLTGVKQGFKIEAVWHVQIGFPLKNLQEERRNEAGCRRAHGRMKSTHLGVKVHERFRNVRMIPRPCQINKRSEKSPTEVAGKAFGDGRHLAGI